MTIQFKFEAKKTVEAAAIFLDLHGGKMKYLGLIKLLYIADRITLQRTNYPITGDKYVSMKYGPVLSTVYDFIKNNSTDKEGIKIWKQYISTKEKSKGFEVKLLNSPYIEELCEEEIEIIKEVHSKYKKYDGFDLATISHDFPEWEDPGNSSIPIKIDELLKHLKKSYGEIGTIKNTVFREKYLDEYFNEY